MQELQDKITELLGQTIASGALDGMIREKLGKTVDGILADLLSMYSPLGRSLREQLEAALNVNLDLGLGGYNQLVADLVSRRLDAAVEGQWKADLQASLDKMLRAAPASIKVSELLARLVEDHDSDARDDGDWEHATMLIDKTQYKSTWVYLDPHPRSESERYRFMWSFLVTEDGEIASARCKDDDHRDTSRELFRRKRGMEALLFQLHAGKSKVVFDLGEGLHVLDYPHDGCRC